jgi:hypothetical protein
MEPEHEDLLILENSVTATSAARLFVTVMLIVFLGAPVLAMAAPAAERDRAVAFRTVRVPSPMVLMIRSRGFHDDALQRSWAPSLVAVIQFESAASGPGHLAGAVARWRARSLWIPAPIYGRSPPIS